MPTEYVTREKLLLPSSTPSILFSSFCPPTSSSSFALSILFSFCFPLSLLPYTSISSPLDSGHEYCSSSEFWLSIPANFSKATTILQMSFLNLCDSLRSSNFFNTSIFHSVSICCFVFLTLDLQTTSAQAFAHALSASKGLQATLALAQGVHEVVWLWKLAEKGEFKWNTYGKFWEIQSILKSAHLLHGFPPPTAVTPISLANSWHH